MGDFKPYESIPNTEIKKEYKLNATPFFPPITYMQYYFETHSNKNGEMEESKQTISPIELFTDFNLYKTVSCETKNFTLLQFQSCLSKSCLRLKADYHPNSSEPRKYKFPNTIGLLNKLKENNMYNYNL